MIGVEEKISAKSFVHKVIFTERRVCVKPYKLTAIINITVARKEFFLLNVGRFAVLIVES